MNNFFRPAFALLALILGLILCTALPLHAQTSFWIGGGTTGGNPDPNWSNPGNWDGYPSGTNDLVFAETNAQTTNNNDFSPGLHINSLTFNSTAAAFTLQGN